MKPPYIIEWDIRKWIADRGVRSVSLAARGLWFDMLCLMAENGRRGYLQQASGSPLPLDQLARHTGASTDEVTRLLRELEDSGVFSRTSEDVIFNRRMVRHERKRQLCAEAGRRGGSPRLKVTLKGRSKGQIKGSPEGPPKGQAEPQQQPGDAPPAETKGGSVSKGSKKPKSLVLPEELRTAYHELIKYLYETIGPISDGAAQGEAIKWLLTNGFSIADCKACLDDQKRTWKQGRISWLSVKTHISSWLIQRGNGSGKTKHDSGSGTIASGATEANRFRPAHAFGKRSGDA